MLQYRNLKSIALGVAGVGAFFTYIGMNTVPSILNKKIRKTDAYKQAVELLHKHPEAVNNLGEPIKEGRINVTKRKKYGYDENTAWFVVPVTGSKTQGELFYDCTVNKNQPLQLKNVELTLNNLKGYKLLIKKAN